MKQLTLTALLLVAAVFVGCEERPSQSIKRLAVNDKPLSNREIEWTSSVLKRSDSVVATDSAIFFRQVWTCAPDGTLRSDDDGGGIYVVTAQAYVAQWGKIILTGSHGNGSYHSTTIDGVENVRETGRWWRVVRETLNRLAQANDYKAWQADSVRLFKLDSTMRSIGR